MSCGLCEQHEALRAHGEPARAAGRIRVDRAALRRALGGRAELVERDQAKASGRPTVNVARMWSVLTANLYQSGDLPVLAAREGLQNSVDALRAALKARQINAEAGRFEVRFDPNTWTLAFDDNGVGMDAETILTKFLSLGDSGKSHATDSGEAAGGFGIAKAVILGVSRSFRWELHTRDNLAVARGLDQDVQIFAAPPRQGTRITVHDLDPEQYWHWDRARGAYVSLEDRLAELLGANDLPGVTLVLNGSPVPPLFSRRGGSKVKVEADWGPGTSATIKAYRRAPGDRGGAYYIRLNGLFQFKVASYRGNLKADIVLDLHTSVRPGAPAYPFNAGRDALQRQPAHAFADLVEEVERENESAGRSEEDEVFDPDSDNPVEREGAEALGAQLSAALADEAVKRALSAAAGGIVDFYAERARASLSEEPIASLAPAGSKAAPAEALLSPILPAGFGVTADPPVEPDLQHPGQARVAVIRRFLQQSDEAAASGEPRAADRTWVGRAAREIFSPAVEGALDQLALGEADERAVATVEKAIGRAMESGFAPGGGGLFQVAAAPAALAALDEAAGQKKARRNPFAGYAGLRISRKTYDRARARRFVKNYARWVPYLLAWDGALRLVAAEARVRRRFAPGFVLDDNLNGLASRVGDRPLVIYIHPDRFAEVVRAHKARPIAIAAYLHSVAVHELTHADGRMGEGHSEEFVSAREDLGRATAHLLPAISALVVRLLDLPLSPDSDAARAERLGAQVVKLQDQLKEARAKLQQVSRRLEALQAHTSAHRTEGTRLGWSTLSAWLDGWARLSARRSSEARHAALEAHLAALDDALVIEATPEDREALEALLRGLRPPRGARQDHPRTRLLDALDRARHPRSPAAELLRLAAQHLRDAPPAGLDPSDIDGFLRRHRGELLRRITAALGGTA